MHIALMVMISYILWFFALQTKGASFTVASTTENELDDPGKQDPPQVSYYRALEQNLERNWTLFETDYEHSARTLKNTHAALVEAIDAAGSTGMLALNAMMAATQTGEVGRGFVTVSKDLVAISEQSIEDLNTLKHLINKADNALSGVAPAVKENVETYFCSSDQFPFKNMELLAFHLQECQDSLRRLAERYQKNLKSDVRWLQMGDAVRRLLNELINTLYQLELRLNDVLSDMRLLRLSGSLNDEQLLEIKGSLATIGASD